MKIIDMKSMYGFFFSGLNLGQEIYTVQVASKQEANADEDDEANDENDKKTKKSSKGNGPSLGQKCKSFFAGIADPFIGGSKVFLDKEYLDTAGDDDQIYTCSYYHWEFVMHL